MELANPLLTLLIVAASVFYGVLSGRAKAARLRQIGEYFPFLTYRSWPRWVVLGFFAAVFFMMFSGPFYYWLTMGPLPEGAY